MRIETWLRENKRLLAILFLFLLIGYGGTELASVVDTIINPGFEGGKCYFWGARFNGFPTDWQGQDELHVYSEYENPLLYHESWPLKDEVYWATPNQPSNPSVVWDQHLIGGVDTQTLTVDVQSQIQLEDVNRQGDPLGWNDTDPLSARRVEFWSPIEETTKDNKIEYRLEKQSYLLVPGEFWIGFYFPAIPDKSTVSDWSEGDWQNVQCWFVLYWNEWNNAYQPYWEKDADSPEEITANAEVLREFRGGLPVSAWIKGWEKAGYTDEGERVDDVWWYEAGSDDDYTEEQLATMRQELMAKISFTPERRGQFLDMFTSTDTNFEYEFELEEEKNVKSKSETEQFVRNTIDTGMEPVLYFPITINNLGTYVKSKGFLQGYEIYYPSVYFRIRIIYLLKGTFTYLWTTQVTEEPIEYPEEYERERTTIIYQPGPVTPMVDWFQNPFNQLWIFLILIVAVVIVISVFSPGLWLLLSHLLERES